MKPKCLETRSKYGGLMKVRRYRDSDNSDFRTVEVPESVVKALGQRQIGLLMEAAQRGRDARKKSALLMASISRLLDEGWKPTAIAHELGCTDSYVRQVRSRRKAP